jgi:hypothetical protein
VPVSRGGITNEPFVVVVVAVVVLDADAVEVDVADVAGADGLLLVALPREHAAKPSAVTPRRNPRRVTEAELRL